MVNFVLNAPRREELPLIEEAIARSLDTWPLLLEGKGEAAMLKLHTKA
jgi:PTH1 family peptidyl-tRNA hydrolase